MAYSPPGSSVCGILQVRTLEWVGRRVGVPSPGNLPDPGIEPRFSALQRDSLPSEPPWKPRIYLFTIISQTQHSLQVLSKVGGGINYEFGINTDTPPSSLRSVLFDSLLPHGTVAHQAPLSMGFSRQEYWSGLLPVPFPGDLPNPGIESRSPALQTNSFPSEPPRKPTDTLLYIK